MYKKYGISAKCAIAVCCSNSFAVHAVRRVVLHSMFFFWSAATPALSFYLSRFFSISLFLACIAFPFIHLFGYLCLSIVACTPRICVSATHTHTHTHWHTLIVFSRQTIRNKLAHNSRIRLNEWPTETKHTKWTTKKKRSRETKQTKCE